MPEGTTGGAALSSPSVADFVSQLHGDWIENEPESEDAGAPPATTSEGQESTADSSEGTDPSVATDDATQPAPDDSTTPDAQTETDPLDGSSPMAYTVNGEARTFDGVTVLKDGGAIVEPEALEKLQRIFTERDHLYERAQETHRQAESLNRLLEWTPPGSKSALQGREAVEALHLSRAELLAEVKAFHALLGNPENLRNVLVANEDGTLAWNQMGVDNFQAKLDNTKLRIQQAVSKHFAERASTPTQPQQFDPAALAPQATELAVKALGQASKGWTAEDKAWAESLAPRFTRLATREDQQANPALAAGQPMVEQQFFDLVAERASLRAGTAKVASSATDAAKANAARIAAAKTGQRTPNAPKITPTKEPVRTRDDDFSDAWDRQQAAAAGALRAHIHGR